jgi:hypothetical protein
MPGIILSQISLSFSTTGLKMFQQQEYIDSVFVGIWTDAVVRNTNVTGRPSGSAFLSTRVVMDTTIRLKLAYEFDAAGDLGFTDSYVGVLYLGGSDPRTTR